MASAETISSLAKVSRPATRQLLGGLGVLKKSTGRLTTRAATESARPGSTPFDLSRSFAHRPVLLRRPTNCWQQPSSDGSTLRQWQPH